MPARTGRRVACAPMNLGPFELGLILLAIVLLFGGAKLPKLARSLGSAKSEFRKGARTGADDPSETEA